MKIHEARVFKYSVSHKDEVLVKYSLSPADDWHKFIMESPGPSFPEIPAYSGVLPLNQSKVDDLKKIVYKFVPREFRPFYDAIIEENISSNSTQSED